MAKCSDQTLDSVSSKLCKLSQRRLGHFLKLLAGFEFPKARRFEITVLHFRFKVFYPMIWRMVDCPCTWPCVRLLKDSQVVNGGLKLVARGNSKTS